MPPTGKGARSDAYKRELGGPENAVVEGQGAGEYTLGDMGPKENVPSGDRRHQKPGVCASRPRRPE